MPFLFSKISHPGTTPAPGVVFRALAENFPSPCKL
jgi:hypothetical protein